MSEVSQHFNSFIINLLETQSIEVSHSYIEMHPAVLILLMA